MKEKVKEFLKNDGMYLLSGIVLLVITLLIVTVKHKTDIDYTLNLPSNNTYGLVSYLVIIICGILGIVAFRNIDRKQIKLEKVFLMLVIPLGILYCLTNPLGRIPDEDYHVRKSMAIAQGHIFSDSRDTFPAKVIALVSCQTSSYEDALNRIKLEETDETRLVEYSTMALYAPICHLPQALGIMVTKLFGGNIVVQCYAGRIVNFALSVFLIYYAIKLIPFKKYIILCISLLPMTLCEFASMSSDALTIAISIFFTCYILYLKYDESKKQVTGKDIAILAISSIVVALSKIVYIPLVLLIFILPKEKFGSLKKKNITTIIIAVCSIIINLIWLAYCSRFLIEFRPGVDSGDQVKFVLTHPIRYILIAFRTWNDNLTLYLPQLFGEGLANLQQSSIFIYSSIPLALLILVTNEDEDRVKIDTFTRCTFIFVFLAIFALICTSLYVQWTRVANSLIEGIQIRYLLPILPLFIIIANNNRIIFNGKLSKRYIVQFLIFFNLSAITTLMFNYF